MEKNNHKNIDKENKVPKVGIYIRNGNIEQFNTEAEQRDSILKMVRSQKGEYNVDSSCEKERGISYIDPGRI